MRAFARLILIASALSVAVPLAAARADTVTVSFPKGSTGTTVSGKLKGDDFHDYVVRAKAGQVMNVHMSGSNILFFNVLPPGSDNEAIFIGSNEGNDFSGTLGASGDYKIRVYQMRSSGRRGESGTFKLAISVEGASGGSGSSSSVSLAGIAGMNSIDAIDEMSGRGFKDVDSFSSGNTQYGIFYNRQAGMCVQLTMADGKVVDASDIQTHPKCR